MIDTRAGWKEQAKTNQTMGDPLWGELSSASENNVFLLNALLFVFFFLFVFVFCRGLVGSSPLVERRSLDLA